MVFYLLCQWLTTVIVVRLSGYGDAGNFSLAMSLSNSFSSIALYGTRSFQVSDVRNEYTSGVYISTRIITCSTSIVLCLLFITFNRYSFGVMACIVAYMLFRIAEAIVDVFQGIEQKAWRIDIIGKSFILRGLVTIIAFTGILLLFHNLVYAILGMVFGSFIVVLFYDIPQSKRLDSIRPVFRRRSIQKLLWTCLPLTINTFITSGLVTLPRLFLENYYGEELLGIYASIAAPTVIIQTAASFIFNPLITLFAKDYVNVDRKSFLIRLKKSSLILIGLSSLAIVAAAIFGKFGLRILFGNGILDYFYLLIPVVCYSSLYIAAWFINLLLTIMREFKGLLIGNICSIVTCAVASPFLIKSFAATGVNLVMIISTVVQVILFGCFALKKGKEHFSVLQNSK